MNYTWKISNCFVASGHFAYRDCIDPVANDCSVLADFLVRSYPIASTLESLVTLSHGFTHWFFWVTV